MKLNNYETIVYNDCSVLRLHYFEDNYHDIILTESSGKIVWRKKGVVKHTGIELGVCTVTGEKLYIHNHPNSAGIVNQLEFSNGQFINHETGRCSNPSNLVIMKELNAVISGLRYALLSSNCHQFTNTACHNRHYSPPVDTLKKLFLLGALYKVGTSLASNKCQC